VRRHRQLALTFCFCSFTNFCWNMPRAASRSSTTLKIVGEPSWESDMTLMLLLILRSRVGGRDEFVNRYRAGATVG
jgi:hypothetical protein